MARDTRYNARDYTEPVVITTKTDKIVDYVVTKDVLETHDWYGQVMLDYQNQVSTNSSDTPNDGIKLKIIKPVKFNIVVQSTTVTVRGIVYIITAAESVATDLEYIVIRGKESKNG